MSDDKVSIAPVSGKRDFKAFVDVKYRLNKDDPNFVPQLRSEEVELLTPGKNPFFEHARHQFFLARRGEKVVGRISAHIDELALTEPADKGFGPGTGQWGLLEAEDAATAQALIANSLQMASSISICRSMAGSSRRPSTTRQPCLAVLGSIASTRPTAP